MPNGGGHLVPAAELQECQSELARERHAHEQTKRKLRLVRRKLVVIQEAVAHIELWAGQAVERCDKL